MLPGLLNSYIKEAKGRADDGRRDAGYRDIQSWVERK